MNFLSPQRLVSWMSTMGSRFQGQRLYDQELQAAIELVVDVALSPLEVPSKGAHQFPLPITIQSPTTARMAQREKRRLTARTMEMGTILISS